MTEDELMTVNYEEEDYEPIVPDGWAEGDDFFADPKTWSGNASESGQTEEPQSELESIAADMEAEDTLAMGESEETTGRSAEEETVEPESGQTEEPVNPSRILQLPYNHETLEVDFGKMSDAQLIEMYQKYRAFDAHKEDQMKARYREVYQDQISAGMTEAIAKMVAANECNGKTYPLEDTAEDAPAAAPVEQPAAAPAARDFALEVQQLKALYPDFKETPDEVALAVAKGTNLLTAYVAYREKQTSKAAASLKKENEVLKQNAASAAKAPVKGVTGGGATDTKPKNNLLVGFDEDYW